MCSGAAAARARGDSARGRIGPRGNMKIGVAAEKFPGERRVALVPATIVALKKAGLDVLIERNAGREAGFTDAAYQEKGAQLVDTRSGIFNTADVVLQVRAGGAAGDQGRQDLSLMKSGQIVIGMADPLGAPQGVRELAATGVTAFALELIPRITRAQSMDVLSSMATDRRLQGRAACRQYAAAHVSALDDGSRHGHAGPRLHRRRRRRRAAGDFNGAPARCGGRGLRRAAGCEGTGAERRRKIRRAAARDRRRRKTRAATRKRRTKRFISASAR